MGSSSAASGKQQLVTNGERFDVFDNCVPPKIIQSPSTIGAQARRDNN